MNKLYSFATTASIYVGGITGISYEKVLGTVRTVPIRNKVCYFGGFPSTKLALNIRGDTSDQPLVPERAVTQSSQSVTQLTCPLKPPVCHKVQAFIGPSWECGSRCG